MVDKKLKPDVLLKVEGPKLQQLQMTAKKEFDVIFKRIKNSDGTLNALHMEVIIAEMWLKLIRLCHGASLNNPSQTPLLHSMIDRMHVLTNQMEEICIYGRDIEIDDEEGGEHKDNVILFDNNRAPEAVIDAYADAGVAVETQSSVQGLAEEPDTGDANQDQSVQP